jgi:hypothetical protein
LNNDVANLSAQLKICKSDYEKLKFARDAYTIGRHPSIKDGLGFQKGTKKLTSQRISNLNKEKGKAPMASSSHSSHNKKNHAYLYAHVKNVQHYRCYNHASLPTYHDVLILMPCLHLAVHMLVVQIDLGAIMLLLMRLGMHQMDQPCFIKHMMLHLFFCARMIK